MNLDSGFIYFNLAYATALVIFLILFYFEIEIIFLTNFIIIISATLLFVKILNWYFIDRNLGRASKNERQKKNLFRLFYCILTYITPFYCIIQQPVLVVSYYISAVTLTIAVLLAIVTIIIEKFLKTIECNKKNLNSY